MLWRFLNENWKNVIFARCDYGLQRKLEIHFRANKEITFQKIVDIMKICPSPLTIDLVVVNDIEIWPDVYISPLSQFLSESSHKLFKIKVCVLLKL